jgi:hypothetical protein
MGFNIFHQKRDCRWPSVPSEKDTQSADIREKWFVRSSEIWQRDSNRNLSMVFVGYDPRIWGSTENRFNDCASRAAESMSSEAYQGPIHKLILQRKSKQNPEFSDYRVVVWLFPWTNLCIWLFEGMEKLSIFLIFIAFQSTMWPELCQYRRNGNIIWSNIYSWYFQIDSLCDIRLWIDKSHLVMNNHIYHLRKSRNWFLIFSAFQSTMWPELCQRRRNESRIWYNIYSWYFQIFFVILDYGLMNPVSIRWQHIEYTGSRSFKVSISDRHSERLYCQYLEKGRDSESEKSITCMKEWTNTENHYDNDVGPS